MTDPDRLALIRDFEARARGARDAGTSRGFGMALAFTICADALRTPKERLRHELGYGDAPAGTDPQLRTLHGYDGPLVVEHVGTITLTEDV